MAYLHIFHRFHPWGFPPSTHSSDCNIRGVVFCRDFLQGVQSKDVLFVPIEDGYHEVLFEEHAEKTLDDMIAWILQHALSNDSKM